MNDDDEDELMMKQRTGSFVVGVARPLGRRNAAGTFII
jgi:hypothetical protein